MLRLEDLPVDIFMEISEYFTVHELYFSFAHLNIRLDSILKSLPTLQLTTTSHQDPVLFFFRSFSAIEIHFDHSESFSLMQYNLSDFVGIQSFIIDSSIRPEDNMKPVEQLENILHPYLSPHLQILRIPHCSGRLAYWIFTGAFSQLRICHLYDDRCSSFVLPSWKNHQLSSLRQLTMRNLLDNELENILLLCPNLTYLDLLYDSVLPTFRHIHSSYSSLKRLRLSRFKSFLFRHTNHFDLLLSYFPNLTRLYLTVDQCLKHAEILDFYEIAQSLHRCVPYLNTLTLRIYVTSVNRSLLIRRTFKQITQLHPLFKCLGRSGNLMHIASHDFTGICFYDHQFVCRSTE